MATGRYIQISKMNLSVKHSGKGAAIAEALEMQGRVVLAIMLRETKSRYGEHKLGFVWVLIEPILFIAGFAAIRAIVGFNPPHGMGAELFMLTGMVPFLLFRGTMQQVSGAISANKALLSFPQVTTFDLILARALLEFATIASVFFILSLLLIAFGIEIRIQYPLQFFSGCVLLFIIGLGTGAALGSLAPFVPSVKQLSQHLFGRPLLFTSGIFFTVDQFPESAQNILLYNPLLHYIEYARSAFFASFESRHYDLNYAGLFGLIVLVFGLTVHQALHKRAMSL